MTAALRQVAPADPVADAARQLGRLGGRPKGSYSSPLAKWLRAEIRNRQSEGYGCREAFSILANTENSSGRDAFTVTDWTADTYCLDIGAHVTWDYWRRLWNAG